MVAENHTVAPSGLIPTFGAVDISHFRLISANTKRLFRSDQSTSARCFSEASPAAGAIDSQSVKSEEKGGVSIDPPRYDAGKKIKGKKRHLLVDTLGLILTAVVHPANLQDRAAPCWCLISAPAGCFPSWRLRWSHYFGQFGDLAKVYSSV